MKRVWITLASGLLIIMIGIPTITAAISRTSPTSGSTAASTTAPGPVPVQASGAMTPCNEQTALVDAARATINDKWTIVANRAKQLGATDANIADAKAILLSSDSPEKRQADLMILYQKSAFKNLDVADLQKVYDAVDARTAYEKALAAAATACPSLFDPVLRGKVEPSTDPMTGADAEPGTRALPQAADPAQVKVIPSKAPETGDGSLAP